jgi:hypothetical protein
MGESVRVEGRPDSPVHHAQDVQVELGRESLGIVVGRLQRLHRLPRTRLQIHAQEQLIAPSHDRPDLGKESIRIPGREVPEGGAKEHEPGRRGQFDGQVQGLGEVGNLRNDA